VFRDLGNHRVLVLRKGESLGRFGQIRLRNQSLYLYSDRLLRQHLASSYSSFCCVFSSYRGTLFSMSLRRPMPFAVQRV